MGFHLLFVHAAVARCDDQHRRIVAFAPEDDALGHLPHQNAQRISGLLRSARGIVQHLRQVRVAEPLQLGSHTLYALGKICGNFLHVHSSLFLINGYKNFALLAAPLCNAGWTSAPVRYRSSFERACARISRTPRPSFARSKALSDTPSAYPTAAATLSMLSVVVSNRWTACCSRRF